MERILISSSRLIFHLMNVQIISHLITLSTEHGAPYTVLVNFTQQYFSRAHAATKIDRTAAKAKKLYSRLGTSKTPEREREADRVKNTRINRRLIVVIVTFPF